MRKPEILAAMPSAERPTAETSLRRRRLLAAAAGLVATLPLGAKAQTNDKKFIMNRWKQDQYLHIQRGPVEASQIDFRWWSAQWFFLPAVLNESGGSQAANMFRAQKRGYLIQNVWKPDHYLHVEGGVLKTGPVSDPPAASAFWSQVPAGEDFVRILNYGEADMYLQIDGSGAARVGPALSTYWSAHWRPYVVPAAYR